MQCARLEPVLHQDGVVASHVQEFYPQVHTQRIERRLRLAVRTPQLRDLNIVLVAIEVAAKALPLALLAGRKLVAPVRVLCDIFEASDEDAKGTALTWMRPS